jgi:hypothetical protein
MRYPADISRSSQPSRKNLALLSLLVTCAHERSILRSVCTGSHAVNLGRSLPLENTDTVMRSSEIYWDRAVSVDGRRDMPPTYHIRSIPQPPRMTSRSRHTYL